MFWRDQVRREFELPKPPRDQESQRVYVYKKGKAICQCMYNDLPNQEELPKPEPPDQFGDPPTPSEMEKHLEENGYLLEKETVFEVQERLQNEYETALDAKFQEIYRALCGPKYLGIQVCDAAWVLFTLACRECREWRYGYHYLEFLNKVAGQFSTYCTTMKDHLVPLEGCYKHNSSMEGPHYIFTHWTEFDGNAGSFSARIEGFMKDEAHSRKDRIAIAREFFQSAEAAGRLDLIPMTFLEFYPVVAEERSPDQKESR